MASPALQINPTFFHLPFWWPNAGDSGLKAPDVTARAEGPGNIIPNDTPGSVRATHHMPVIFLKLPAGQPPKPALMSPPMNGVISKMVTQNGRYAL
jgi:hypothetical protein